MPLVPDMAAPFTVVLPDDWERLSLLDSDAEIEANVRRCAALMVGDDVPRDRRPVAIERARRYLRDALEDARVHNVHGVTLPIGLMARQISTGMSLFDFEYDTSDTRRVSLGMLRAGAIWSGEHSTPFETAFGLKGLRIDQFEQDASVYGGHPGIDAVICLYAFPVPDRPFRWKGLGFSAVLPAGADDQMRRLCESVSALFAETFRFVGTSDEPDAFEERLQEVSAARGPAR